jgi:putative acetyltransferase
MNYFTRRAVVDDLNGILHVFQSSITDISDSKYNQLQKEAWIQKGLSNNSKWIKAISEQYFLVVLGSNEVIAFSSLLNSNYIYYLYVLPAYQRKGIAKKMYKEMLDCSLKAQVKTISTDSSEAALPFFLKQGFKVVEKRIFKTNRVLMHNYLMEIELRLI